MQGAEERVREGTKDQQERETRGTGAQVAHHHCVVTCCMPSTELPTEETSNHMQDPRQRSLTELTSAQRPLADTILPGGRTVESHSQEKVFIIYLPILCSIWTAVP